MACERDLPTAAEVLGRLNPDDPAPASRQIEQLLRIAIAAGVLKPGQPLPSQTALAAHYGVARETVKAALRPLRADRLIVSRQGADTHVRFAPPTVANDRGLPTADEMLDRAAEELDRALKALGDAGDHLRSDWRPLGSPLSEAQAARKRRLWKAIEAAKPAIDKSDRWQR